MLVDSQHLHHWMNAIRTSEDPKRTLDAFWSGQIKSKEWLVERLAEYVSKDSSVDIHGGWVGTLASIMFQSTIPVTSVRSIDIDPSCQAIAEEMNRIECNQGRFRAVTGNMVDIRSDTDIVINTSCEHITQDEYDLWLSGLPQNSLIVLQSNNYDIPEHVRIAKDIHEFERQSGLTRKFVGTLRLPLYHRYMIIGTK